MTSSIVLLDQVFRHMKQNFLKYVIILSVCLSSIISGLNKNIENGCTILLFVLRISQFSDLVANQIDEDRLRVV